MRPRPRSRGADKRIARAARNFIAAAFRGGLGAGIGSDRARSRRADEGGIRSRRGMEPPRSDRGAEPLAGPDAGAPPAAASRRAPPAAALHDPGQYAASQLRAVRLEARRIAGRLSTLSDQRAAPGFRLAGHPDPADASQERKPVRAGLESANLREIRAGGRPEQSVMHAKAAGDAS